MAPGASPTTPQDVYTDFLRQAFTPALQGAGSRGVRLTITARLLTGSLDGRLGRSSRTLGYPTPDAPEEIRAARSAISCGEVVLAISMVLPREATSCPKRSIGGVRTELAVAQHTDEGDPIVTFSVTCPDRIGSDVVVDQREDSSSSRGFFRHRCAGARTSMTPRSAARTAGRAWTADPERLAAHHKTSAQRRRPLPFLATAEQRCLIFVSPPKKKPGEGASTGDSRDRSHRRRGTAVERRLAQARSSRRCQRE